MDLSISEAIATSPPLPKPGSRRIQRPLQPSTSTCGLHRPPHYTSRGLRLTFQTHQPMCSMCTQSFLRTKRAHLDQQVGVMPTGLGACVHSRRAGGGAGRLVEDLLLLEEALQVLGLENPCDEQDTNLGDGPPLGVSVHCNLLVVEVHLYISGRSGKFMWVLQKEHVPVSRAV